MNELRPILYLLGSTFVSLVLIPVGIIHSIGKSFYECFRVNIYFGAIKFIWYWLFFIYQIWNVIKYLFYHLSVAQDLFWNASSGEFVEDCVTTEENTLYGKGDITISQATGDLEAKFKLNKIGKKFSSFLSSVLGKHHCIEAYKKYLINKGL